jgi:hypothetical protein
MEMLLLSSLAAYCYQPGKDMSYLLPEETEMEVIEVIEKKPIKNARFKVLKVVNKV